MPPIEEREDWQKYQMMVLSELTDLKGAVEALRQEVHMGQIKIAVLEVKAGAWGLVGGALVVVGQMVLSYMTAKH